MLNQLKILDFSYLLPGPFTTMLLGDLGADIINFRKESEAENDFDLYLSRNKKVKYINLKCSASVEYVKSLVNDYDIIVEQFRPGVMDKLGLGYEQMREINPNIIYCSITGYGQKGPYASKAGHDINYSSLAGIPSYSGAKGSKPPSLGIQIADLAGGSMYAVTSILAAVIHRMHTGQGQHIDVNMTACTASYNVMAYVSYFGNGEVPSPESMPLNGAMFYDYYETKDGRYFSVGSLEPKFFMQLLKTFNLPDELLADAYSGNIEKVTNVKNILKEQFLKYTFTELKDMFMNTDACVEPVLSIDELESAEHFKGSELFIKQEVDGALTKFFGHPVKFSEFKPTYAFPKKSSIKM